jgi:hypothetical protein
MMICMARKIAHYPELIGDAVIATNIRKDHPHESVAEELTG